MVNTKLGERVFTLQGADTVYRAAIETINEGAITLSPEGTILYSNHYFAKMMRIDLNKVIGTSIFDYIGRDNRDPFTAVLAQGSGRVEIQLREKQMALGKARVDRDGFLVRLIAGKQGAERALSALHVVDQAFELVDGGVEAVIQAGIVDGLADGHGLRAAEHVDGQAMLQDLEKRNLFLVPLDDARHWYRYHHLFADVLNRHLKVMDSTAISLCMDNAIPIIVFDLHAAGNIKRVVCGEPIGTLVH